MRLKGRDRPPAVADLKPYAGETVSRDVAVLTAVVRFELEA